MKYTHLCIMLLCTIVPCKLFAQSFTGLADSGLVAAFTNPAFVCNEDDPIQVNIIGASGLVANNGYSLFTRGGSGVIQTDPRSNMAVWGNIDILGPGVSFVVKKKYPFAITTRTRTLVNIDNISKNVYSLFGSDNPDTIMYHLHNTAMVAQLVSEVSLTYANYIYASEEQSLKGGVSVKLLIGSGAVAVGIPDATFKVQAGNTITNVNGDLNACFTPYANQWLSTANIFSYLSNKTTNYGLGVDLGLVYEYMPNNAMQLRKGYLFRLSASITDIGGIGYMASNTSGSYHAQADTFSINSIDKSKYTTYGTTIQKNINDSTITATATKSKFRVGLPTALHLNGDFHMTNAFYLNADALINLRSPSASKFASHYITTFCVAPRYVFGHFAVGMPFSVNTFAQGNIGCILYLGPVYIGTNSMLQFLAVNNTTNADVFAGISLKLHRKEREGYDISL